MRKIKRICRKLGIPRDREILGLTGAIIVIFLGLSQLAIAKVFDGNFWGGRFTFSVPYEKIEQGVAIRKGLFEGEASFNPDKNCWEVNGKTKEGSLGTLREEVRTKNCHIIVNPIR